MNNLQAYATLANSIWLTQVQSLARNSWLKLWSPLTTMQANARKRLNKDLYVDAWRAYCAPKILCVASFRALVASPRCLDEPWPSGIAVKLLASIPASRLSMGFSPFCNKIFLLRSQEWSKIWNKFEDSEHSEDKLGIDKGAAKICATTGQLLGQLLSRFGKKSLSSSL